ncbi:MAG: transcription termination factor NusA [Candidatus Omnitrophica bacterium]|nr:transcription termination factor NusA [Candidatus Omnitrophota bacterium]MBU1128165.1 transcription termination factor NusA [Candidatus Omnitrophota bacterium]MBU1785087.1 transcription termination factor NusA [Candidatus Omnitrophota bacterium]MBU1851476.1 transcription termination factor NusA [Candidatus Omnitrophota bacterium]
MNDKLLAAIERLEREKGISKEILFSAIESALTSAAYKIIGDPNLSKEEISVEMDVETGEITVFKGDTEVESEQFGRIAAQTAKQVMIQKIREAERDVISEKYQDREGEIISGSVHRFEKGNIIVELTDTEAVLPRSEQIPGERFRQGEIIRACLLKVERKTGGLNIILSRSNPAFVKKLFELEVPEIAQGILEIVAIAREAGERTKISVLSKDERIDSVGACVGMRGSRVKEIVRELSGERIDIVRWNDDIAEYVRGAVSPVEIYGMEIDRDAREIKLTVLKDQLALLIGKKGRNIRLASKLVGWELKADAVVEDVDVPVRKVSGFDEETMASLENAGYRNVSELLEAGAEKVAEIDSIGEEKAAEIILTGEAALEAAVSARQDDPGETKKDDNGDGASAHDDQTNVDAETDEKKTSVEEKAAGESDLEAEEAEAGRGEIETEGLSENATEDQDKE